MQEIQTLEKANKQSKRSAMPEIIRKFHYAEKVVFCTGQPGCGKTMLSPIIAALDRVELLTYAYEVEHMCELYYLGKMELDAAVAMIRMLTDLQLYNTMMCRETNFRPSDLSSVFQSPNKMRFFKRLFFKGDESVLVRIENERPILNLTVHALLGMAEPVFAGLGDRVVALEVMRHPLYMVKQQFLNFKRIVATARHFTVNFKRGDHLIPYFAYGWEEKYIQANDMDRVIYTIQHFTGRIEEQKILLRQKYQANIISIPFECFVLDPWPYLEEITNALGTKMTSTTYRMLKKQNVPRKRLADGISLPVYKRCGWQPPVAGASERDELKIRREVAAQTASTEAMEVLDFLSREYEKRYWAPSENA